MSVRNPSAIKPQCRSDPGYQFTINTTHTENRIKKHWENVAK